jgi:hypothetical protein
MGTSEVSRTERAEVDGESLSGVHVEMVVGDSTCCPVTAISDECDTTVSSVSRGRGPQCGSLVEFTMPSDADPSRQDLRQVYASDSDARYQCSVARDGQCPCDFIESEFGPVETAHATRGQLYVSFFAPDVDEARTIVAGAREVFDDVRVQHITAGKGLSGSDSVVIDRSCLTDRQREVLETAHEMGYYDHPKRANATEVADELGISQTTFSEHLAAAQCKLLSELLDASE